MIKYQDKIYLVPDDAGTYEESYNDETLVWSSKEYDSRWGHDNEPDSEYHKMMELHSQYDFTDYDNCPSFDHLVFENVYYDSGKHKGELKESKCVKIYSLIEEYFNT